MSLLDDVSIVVTPNGYKAGTLYAVKPTFALGSELVTNSIFNSDNTSGWGNGFYDSFTFNSSEGGFYNLQRVTADARTSINLSSVLTVGKRYKVTVVARGSGDIKTGLTTSNYSTQPSAIFTLTSSFASYSTVVTVTSGLVYGVLWNDDGNSNIDYQSYSVKEYTSADMDVTRATAATRVDEDGLIEDVLSNVPRIDYTGGGCPHILAEPERTNLVTYSESYGSGTYFSATNGSVIDNTTSISPSGENNATQITSTGAGKLQSSGQSLTQNTDYVLSFYAKNVDATEVKSRVLASGGSGGENLTSVSYISELSTTEWTRITHIFNTGTNTTFYVFLSNALNSGGTIQLWGAQLEEATYATSYIPTDGGTVTRVKDQYSKTGISNLINSEEGSFFVDIAALNQPPWAQISISLSGNGSNDRVLIYTGSGGGKWITQFRKAGTIIVNVEKSVTITNQSKVAISWKSGKYLMYIDGDKATNYTEGSETHSVTFDADDLKNLQFSPNHSSSSNYFNGKVKHLQVYTTALTDSELKTLTT